MGAPGTGTGMPLVVALTGGVASGKSLACSRFAAGGAPVLDADVASRELVAAGTPALARIVEAFGPGALDDQGNLDRARMRERIFVDPPSRTRLERILHPAIEDHLLAQATASDAAYVVVAIPLLAEVGRYDWLDRVLVVDAPVERQLDRLCRRDGIDHALAARMIAAQAPRDRRLALADDVICNDADADVLLVAVDLLDRRYRLQAADASAARSAGSA